ncbi:MAG: hypothetical protein ACQESW_13490 [Bacteroidota bacterium]
MKTILFFMAMMMMSLSAAFAQTETSVPDDIVSFLNGKWHNYSFFIADGNPVGKQDYRETMKRKNDSTLTITAHGYKEGEDLTRDMFLVEEDSTIVMRQGNFEAVGKREGNVYYLKGEAGDKEYRFRLYTLGDKYIFHSEVWAEGKMEMMNMSYLERE